MRALQCKQYGSPSELVLESVDDPSPGKGEILVAVKAAGINFPDVLAIAGQYQVKTEPPFIPGNEGAGVVEALGEGVTRYAVGDEVMFMSTGGAFAEKCAVDVELVMPLIPECSFVQGAGFTITYGTSYHAFKQRADLQPKETVLVLGAAGGVGVTAVEIAKAMGATVIAGASTDDKLEFAREAGADHLINYSDQALNEAVKELTGGNGADVVYDPVGGELAQQALRATAWHGRYLVIGFASGEIPKFPANLALLKEAAIVGVWWGTWARKNPAVQAQNVREMAALVAAGTLKPRVTEHYALDEYVKAFAAITERRALGKVVLTMD